MNLHRLIPIIAITSMITITQLGGSQKSLAQTPAALWTFDAGSGTSAVDTSGGGHTATLTGATWASPGKVGASSLKLSGSGQYAQAAGAIVNTSSSFTAAAWVKLNAVTGYQTVLSIDAGQVSGFYLQLNGGTGKFAFNRLASDSVSAASTVASATAAPSTGAWYHLAGVYNSTAHTLALYVNGVLQQSVAFTPVWQATGNTAIGRGRFNSGNVDFVNGTIDDARLYASALTQAQIQTLVNLGGTTGCPAPTSGSHSTNPLFTDQYTADPAPFVDNCTFYIACGHDQGTTGFNLNEWFELSTTDMVHWTKNVKMTLGVFSWASANAWAGQIVKGKNGKYYWYVPVAKASDGSMAIGVATSTSATGPWTDALGHPLVDDTFEMSNMGFTTPGQTAYTIDPTVFVDDDGSAYLHYGGFWRMVEARLGADMISISGTMIESTPQGYFEAPYLFKRNGVYYEVYAAGANPATIDYATSNSAMGPWTYRGRVLDALPAAAGQDAPTNHAGEIEFAGQWYIVYHISNGPNGGGTYKREVCVDKLFFNSDGTIQHVTPTSGMSF